ncbi:4-hydroxy-3-methylbut-2-en-1-yl diphosphate synthase [Campylobacter sp. faydin G-105]|uniref:4-hydroxy-3-methylbut-2-en-1-yl diphosphate synthase n=1 Tax=Campylobacter anatolicus TaxID=2829105 RepID=UPI001B978802|nr:4-hydroxy-3-methylbut-2-en-1-yl diphosphate synthase [Campylobacter anatolicus]MBR8461748.1 4-hydroxy-3-methylbut-2-en-1-yl diphosphate synthase [Campylobacter anatolicus]
MQNKKTFWPYGIVLSIIACIIACIATIIIALKHPVQLDTFFIDRYQNVDDNITEIQISQKRFDDKFELKFDNLKIYPLTSDFKFKIISKNGEMPKFLAQAILSKPETNEFNVDINITQNGDELSTDKIKLAKNGRWQILLKLNDGVNTRFYKLEFFAR